MLEPLFDRLEGIVDGIQEELDIVRMIQEERNDNSPDSIKLRTVEEVLYEFQGDAVRMIVGDQMWDKSINMYGQRLPKYKPDTVRKKAKIAGYPADKLLYYTNFWTGVMANYCIKIRVSLTGDSYDFKLYDYPNNEDQVLPLSDAEEMPPLDELPRGFKPYSLFVPPDRIGLTDENIAIFEEEVMREVADRLDRWQYKRLQEEGITPENYGFFGF